jgi:hypothetical protein
MSRRGSISIISSSLPRQVYRLLMLSEMISISCWFEDFVHASSLSLPLISLLKLSVTFLMIVASALLRLSFRTRRVIELYRFFTMCSLRRPSKCLAIFDQAIPLRLTSSMSLRSSSRVHLFLFRSGLRWLAHISRQFLWALKNSAEQEAYSS